MDRQGRILAVAFGNKFLNPWKVFPLRSEATRLNPNRTEGLESGFGQISSILEKKEGHYQCSPRCKTSTEISKVKPSRNRNRNRIENENETEISKPKTETEIRNRFENRKSKTENRKPTPQTASKTETQTRNAGVGVRGIAGGRRFGAYPGPWQVLSSPNHQPSEGEQIAFLSLLILMETRELWYKSKGAK